MAIKPGSLGRPRGPTHRTQEERNATTRKKLIEAAIHCLRTYGYAASSVALIAEMAHLSRGAVLHQFGTKVDLMLAVAEHIVEEQYLFMQERVQQYAPGRDRFIGLTDATWDSINLPGFMALLEITMASRSDADLGERFPAVAEKLARRQQRGAWSLARLAGITDQAAVDTMSQLHRAAMEGLALRAMSPNGSEAVEPMLKLLNEYKILMTDKLIAEAQKAETPAAGKASPVRKARADAQS